MNEEKIEKKVEGKKWQRPGRVPIGGQVERWMFDKVCEVSERNNISRTKVLEDALDCYFNDRRVEVEVEKEVVKEVPREKTDYEIDIREMCPDRLAVILELSTKLDCDYMAVIEILCKYIEKHEGKVEDYYIKQAEKIIIK